MQRMPTHNGLNIAVSLVAILAGGAIVSLCEPGAKEAAQPPMEAPVPLQEGTPAADAGPVLKAVLGKLPPPGPNQVKDAGKCRWPAQFLDGGCWMAVADEKPPCTSPDGTARAWPHDGRCWVRYLEAKPVPQSGDPRHRGVAEP